jgi:1A family penicillin-binding protein
MRLEVNSRPSLRSLAGLLVALALLSACELRPVDLDEERKLPLRSSIYAADGSLLTRMYSQNRVLAPIEDIPTNVIDAVVAAEDQRFFAHDGYDVKAIARAALANAEEDAVVQGGSTITQQYVKNTYFRHPARSFERKLRELRLAIEVERIYSKEEILERYLNTVYFGDGAYGIRTAAHVFFGHGLGDLNLRESALLAAVIKSPTLYNPRDHARRARARRNYVLDRMATLGKITSRRAARAKHSSLGVLEDPPQAPTKEPYFVEAVKRELLRDPRLGSNPEERAKMLYKGGLAVETTLEPELQRAARGAVDSILDQPGDPEAALVAIRPKTGAIVAMIGGRDWKASQVNLALGAAGGGSGRQPGSSFKPLALAAALESGVHLTDLYQSSPVFFTFPDGSTWDVDNAEGGGYGPMSLFEATVHSVNGVYARLAVEIGAGQIASQARTMGVRSKLRPYPAIALGAQEVSALDMATAYATLANGGTAIEPTTIRSVTTPDGVKLEPEQKRVEGAVSAGNTYLISKVLEQVIQRGTGRAAAIGRPAAGKTGTTNDYGDAWFVGYTPDLVAAVWVGYPKGRIPMTSVHGIRVFGGTFPAQIWRAFMMRALDGVPPRGFKIPSSDLVRVEIDPASRLLAAPWCPGVVKTMLRQLVPTETCPPPPPPEPPPAPTPTPTETPKPDEPEGDKSTGPEATPSPEPTPEPTPTKQ